jgi:ferric-dicitrate binding protein FerR (iron transport regulator)
MREITGLLVDYVNDALPPEARAAVEARLRTDAEFHATAAPLLAVWRMTPAPPVDTDTDAAVAALRAAIAADDALALVRRRRRPVRTLAIATATLVACAVLSVYGPGFYRIIAPVVRAHDVESYATTVGERRTVRLPDGSWATLGPGSRVHYRATLFAPAPQVTVHGAVAFDVVADTNGPLIVYAGSARVVATGGARFSVLAYPGDADVRVAVTEARVQVAAGRGVVWTAAQGVTAHVTDTAVVFRRTADDGTIAWDDARLTLTGVPLANAIEVIGRWYGIAVRLGDRGLLAATVSATLPVDPHRAIAALPARAVWAADTVTLYAP